MRNLKWLKKTAAMLLAGTLMCGTAAWTGAGFAAEVQAADTTIGQAPATGRLTINKTDGNQKPLAGATFKIYKVISLTPGTVTGTFAKYEKVPAFASALGRANPDALGNFSAQAIEELAATLAKTALDPANGIEADATAVTAEATGMAEFTQLPLGYYLVVETDAPEGGYVAGRPFLVAIPSTNNYNNPEAEGTSWVYDVVASPKNTKTPLEKEIDKTAQGEGLSTDGSVKVGDIVPYKITTTIPDYSDESYNGTKVTFTLTDVMSAGLEIQNAEPYPVTVKVDGSPVEAGDTTYSLTATPVEAERQADLTVDFASAYIRGKSGKDVEITYYAKVTEMAVMGTTGNTNSPDLEITNNPGGETTIIPGPDIKVYSFGLKVVKFTKEGGEKALEGAEFQLYKDEVKEENKLGNPLSTNDQGNINFNRLDEGTYYLVETKAPAGYTLLANPIKVEITAAKDPVTELATGGFTLKIDDKPVDTNTGEFVSKIDQSAGISTVAVENHKGFNLPATGGMGIVLFLAVGAAGIVVVSVLLTRKSKDAK